MRELLDFGQPRLRELAQFEEERVDSRVRQSVRDVEAGLLRIGRARQDHVGAVRAGITVAADINGERAIADLCGVEFVRAKQEELQQILDRANRVVKQVAEAEKYDVILQEAVYVNPRLDITDKVIKALNAGK